MWCSCWNRMFVYDILYAGERSIACKITGRSVMERKASWINTFPVKVPVILRFYGSCFNIFWIIDVGHSKFFNLAPPAKTIQTVKHTQEWWMWWNQCENVTACLCFLGPLCLSGRPLSNSGQQTPRNPTPASCRSNFTWNWYLQWDWAAVQYNNVVLWMVCFSTVLSF